MRPGNTYPWRRARPRAFPRKPGGKKMVTLMGGSAKDADIMAFVELPEE